MPKTNHAINREWMLQRYPMFSESSSAEGFLCRFDEFANLVAAQFIKHKNGEVVFESHCLEIEPSRGLFYATSGMASRHPPVEYRFSDRGVWIQMQSPDIGGPELRKIEFEEWVGGRLNQIIAESKLSGDADTPVNRSLTARKALFK